MASIEELEAGLRKAHAAGQTYHARRFAAEIRRLRTAQTAKADFSGVTAQVIGRPLPVTEEQRNQVLREFGAAPDQRGSPYRRYLAGVGKSMVDTVQGLGQAITDQGVRGAEFAESVARRIDPDAAKQVGDRFRGFQSRQRESVAARRALDPSFSEDPAFGFGNVVGALGQLLLPGTAARGTSLGRAALPTTIKGNALQGMAFGGVQPVAAEGEREVNAALGGTLGTVLPTASKFTTNLLRMAGNALGRGTVSGSTRRAAEILRAEASGLPDLLRPAPSAVPGVQRSLAEESLDPGIARLERSMRSQTNLFDPIDRANNAARVASLQSIAGSDAEMAAAEAARDSATSSLRQQAQQEGRDYSRMSGMMQDLERARLMLQARDVQAINASSAPLRAVGSGASNFPVMTSADIERAVQGASRTDLAPLKSTLASISGSNAGNPAVRATLDRVNAAIDDAGNSVQGLANVRDYINALLSGKAGDDSTAARAATAQLMQMKRAIDEELASRAPTFPQYMSSFAEMSVPINRMQVGRELLDRGAGSAIADPVTGIRPLTPAALSRQALDLDSVAARATGFEKAKASDILTPEDISSIRAIQDDLERQAFRATAGSGGNSQTFERLMLQDKLANRLASRIPVAGGFIEAMSKMADQRVNDKLARLLADPAQARAVLNQLNARDRAVVSKALVQLSGATGSSVPALTE